MSVPGGPAVAAWSVNNASRSTPKHTPRYLFPRETDRPRLRLAAPEAAPGNALHPLPRHPARCGRACPARGEARRLRDEAIAREGPGGRRATAPGRDPRGGHDGGLTRHDIRKADVARQRGRDAAAVAGADPRGPHRSEERRVGKERNIWSE